MNHSLIISFILLFSCNCFGQPLLLNDNVVVTMKNGAKIIVNPSSNNHLGIQLTGTSAGYIVGEEEINKIIWWLRDAGAGSDLVVPFANSAGETVKIKMSNITAGSSDGAMIFATAPTNANNTLISTSAYPTNVTNIYDGADVDNSANVVDRFWFIEYNSYSTKPVAANGFTLYYSDADLGGITEADLKSQYWNTDWIRPSAGTVTTASNYVSAITDPCVSAPWVLVDKDFPLPVELLSFTVKCDGNNDNITWITATENNNSHFEIFKSYDANNWNWIKSIQGFDNSNQSITYNESVIHDKSAYYKIKQIDYNGESREYAPVYVSCEYQTQNESFIQQSFFNNGFYCFESNQSSLSKLKLYNSIGQLIFEKEFYVFEGKNLFILPTEFAKGIYYIRIYKK